MGSLESVASDAPDRALLSGRSREDGWVVKVEPDRELRAVRVRCLSQLEGLQAILHGEELYVCPALYSLIGLSPGRVVLDGALADLEILEVPSDAPLLEPGRYVDTMG
jgi:hypothetical protein